MEIITFIICVIIKIWLHFIVHCLNIRSKTVFYVNLFSLKVTAMSKMAQYFNNKLEV